MDRQRDAVAAVAGRLGLVVDLDTEVRRLAIGVQQKVVPATPTPIDALPRPRITKASVPPRIRPRSSILAMVPTRAYRPSSRGTSTSSRSSSDAAASTAARASCDSRVSVTTIPGRTTPVVSGRSGRVSVSRSDIGMVPFRSMVSTCENVSRGLRIPGREA